jgi:S1-C subfamily serine protease
MSVPCDLLEPILDDILKFGRASRPARPWMGLFATPVEEKLVVAGVVSDGPADKAGVEVGDLILGVDGTPVNELAELFRRIWSAGEAGVEVELDIFRENDLIELSVATGNRYDYLRKPKRH